MKQFLSKHQIPLILLGLVVSLAVLYAFGIELAVASAALFGFGVVTTDGTGGAAAAIPAHNRCYDRIGPVRVTIPDDGVTNDIYQAIPVKAGWVIHGCRYKIVTAGAGTTITLDIGITGVAGAALEDGMDGKGVAGTVGMSTPSDTWPAAGGYYVTADDTVDILLQAITSMTAGTVFDLWLYVEDLDADYGLGL